MTKSNKEIILELAAEYERTNRRGLILLLGVFAVKIIIDILLIIEVMRS